MDESELETRAAAADPEPGALERWGPFEKLQRIGKGSFGEVYRAFDPSLQRYVALKLLLPRGLTRADETAAVLREARATARVRHPNVVPIYGVDRHGGRIGFWSDFVRGQTLRSLIEAQGVMGPREAALVGIDVCKAVGAVHAANLLHRDIKASNVMREEGGRILLMDFGLTHAPGTDDGPSGTPLYMAPEILTGHAASVATDVYAIGVLLFYLMSGRHPVEDVHAPGTRLRLLDLRPDLPEALAHVVETAAHVDPHKRFGSTGQMIAALSDAIGMSPAAALASQATSRRSLARFVIAGLALAAVVVFFVARDPSRPTAIAPLLSAPPTLVGPEDEYRRAHDLIAHYYRPGALETAIPLLEAIVARNPEFAPALADLGRANYLEFTQQRDTKYVEPARQYATRALALSPGLASAHATLGGLYAFTDQNDLAEHELQEALRLDRFNVEAHSGLAELYTRQGRRELIEPTLQKAISLAPEDWGLVSQLGGYYLDNGAWTKASEQFRRAVDLAPDNPRAYNNLGLAYRGLDQLDEAATAFRKAIELDPTFLHYRNLGRVLSDAGQYEEAERAIKRSIEIRPNQYRAWGVLALVYARQRADATVIQESYRKAIALAGDLLKQTPKDAYLLADVGSYYAAIGMESESLPLLARAAALAPEVPDVLYQVALGYEALHRRDDALRYVAKARAGGYSASAVNRSPELADLRADPRFTRAVAQAH